MALNTKTLSLLNKNKAYVDEHYEREGEGFNENDYMYNGGQLTVTYEMPVTPESSVIGLDVRLDNLFYNCPRDIAPKQITSLFDEYKTGIYEKDNVAYLTVNYCGYELIFWHSPDDEYFSDKNLNASIYLDRPYISDENSIIVNSNSNRYNILPFGESKDLFFLSGVGAWCTSMTLNPDGTFTGEFYDSEPSLYYTCIFSGKFGNFEKINDTSYKMELLEIKTEVEPGKEWTENGVLYIASTPYGLDEGTEFILYTPDAATSDLSEDFMNWYRMSTDFNVPAKLGRFGIFNVSAGYGFFE
ncbi:MAG: hypothetical protein IJC10_03875 [Clostridia bacterium]|nr:hypothetical protein [Clostridia bacterium]